MVIIDTVVNTLFGGLTLDPAGMHCPSWDDAFVSSLKFRPQFSNLVAPSTDGSANCLLRYKVHLVV